MTKLDRPQIHTHATKQLAYSPYDVKWLTCSAKFVVLGQHSRGTGALEIYELSEGTVKLVHQTEKQSAFKCGTFSASPLHAHHLATGDFNGNLCVYDLENTTIPVFSVKAHEQIINCIDGCGGVGVNMGPPEIATASRDGVVKIWDTRQKDKPVAKISPTNEIRDCWAVAFGNSFNEQERVIASGYDNGDIKIFDLRNMTLLWEHNVKNGVCGMEFDRKDIKMNKLAVTSLESSFNVFDLRTRHEKKGFACVSEKASDNTTIWTVRHLPQNRDVFITSGGIGGLNLYKYNYPSQRFKKENDQLEGVPGKIQLIQTANVAEQPVGAFDWSADKEGLCVFTAFDQVVRVGIVTKLGTL
jgi:WD40 repeat protein